MSEKEYIEREVLIKQFETLKEKAETLRDVVYLDGVLSELSTPVHKYALPPDT